MRLMLQFAIGLGIILYVLPAFGQRDTLRKRVDRDKWRYERIMEAETEEAFPADSEKLHQYHLLPENLPHWFFKPSEYSTTSVYALGISEPGMDSVKAFELAVLRAKSLAILSTGAKIDNISDHFQVVRESEAVFNEKSRYLDFSRLYNKSLANQGSFKVNKSFYTKYGEAIVLLSYDPSEQAGNDTLAVNGEIMHLSRESYYSLENTVLCRMDINVSPYDSVDGNSLKSRFLLRRRGEHFNISSVYDGDSIGFPFHPYRYTQAIEMKPDSTFKLQSCPLQLGLWNAYINLIFSKISYYNRNLESRVKSSYDYYAMKNQGLIRTVSRNRLKFGIISLALEENELFLKIEISPY